MSIRLSTNADLGDNTLTVAGAHGWERVSDLYEYTVEVEASEAAGLDDAALDSPISSPLALEIATGGVMIHGVVKRLRMTSMLEDTPPRYELTVGPRLSRLELTRRTRVVAQDTDHLAVVKSVLDEHSIAYDDQCRASYPAREYTVQHQESDLAFVLRLMQFNGIHFHFRHRDDEEVLVLADTNAAFEAPEETDQLRYQPSSGRSRTGPRS